MKSKLTIMAAMSLYLAIASPSFAVDGLTISVQSPDVVLTWPSASGETYLIQYRPDVNQDTAWQTLETGYPAAGNSTSYSHSGILQNLVNNSSSLATMQVNTVTPEAPNGLLVVRVDSTTAPPIPFQIFPPGFDMSGYLILDPETDMMVSGNGLIAATTEAPPSPVGEPLPDSTSETTSEYNFYRVVRNGVSFYGLTNGMVLSGYVTLQGDISINTGYVPLDFSLVPDAVVPQPSGIEAYEFTGGNDHPAIVWNTHMATNGTYTLTPQVTFPGNLAYTGPSVTVIVSNRIQVPQQLPWFGTGLPIVATVDINNAPYTITISDPLGNILKTLSDTAVGYSVSNYWDGLDMQGNSLLTNDYVTTSLSFNPTYTSTNWTEKFAAQLQGEWVIANQDKLFSSMNQIRFDNDLDQVQIYAASYGGLVRGQRLKIGVGPTGWTDLMNNYLNYQSAFNLYYYGHGSPTTLGYGSNDRNNGMKASAVGAVLGNKILNRFVINSPFRFVFLDGCQTGSKDSVWPATFGIPPAELSVADFQRLGLQRRAFCGWKKAIVTTTFDSSRYTFVLRLFENWSDSSVPLNTALASAASGTIGTQELQYLKIFGDKTLPQQ